MGMEVGELLKAVNERIIKVCQKTRRSPDEITIVGVTKGIDIRRIQEGIKAGLKILGENYVQEAGRKIAEIIQDVSWHFIGSLQRNKANIAVKLFDLIQSVDSLSLAEKINHAAGNLQKIQDILIEVNLEEEVSKSGISNRGLEALLGEIKCFKNVRVLGLMAIPPWHEDPEKNRKNFSALRQIKERIDKIGFSNWQGNYLSMGMSDDFEIAIEEGSNMVRIGRAIFGERNI